MKISSSSSMLLASLALSASPALAAPTNDNHQYSNPGAGAAVSASSSKRDITAFSNRDAADFASEKQNQVRASAYQHYKRSDVTAQGIPIVGDVLKALCGAVGADAMEAANAGDTKVDAVAGAAPPSTSVFVVDVDVSSLGVLPLPSNLPVPVPGNSPIPLPDMPTDGKDAPVNPPAIPALPTADLPISPPVQPPALPIQLPVGSPLGR